MSMRPFITIEKRANEALEFYESVFPSFTLKSRTHHAEPHNDLVMVAVFSIQGQEIMISDSFISHEWKINPGISFFADLQSKETLENLAASLSDGGKVHMPVGNYGFSSLFGWVEDKFGVNWQLNIQESVDTLD